MKDGVPGAQATAPRPASGDFFTAEEMRRLEHWRDHFLTPQMGLLEALREVQAWRRCIPFEAEPVLARIFSVPPKRVREVASFYPHFTATPTGRCRVAVCRNLSCSLNGAEETLDLLERSLGVAAHHGTGTDASLSTTPDGAFTLEAVECLGACELAPAASVNDELIGRLPAQAVPELLAGLRAELARRPGEGMAALELPAPAPAKVWAPPAGEDHRLLTRHFDRAELAGLAGYRAAGGYAALEAALKHKPEEVAAEVAKSNLRGLGGAGFPTGFKWSTLPPRDKVAKPRYLVVNADESEPGCFKDRVLLERSPHQLIEGMLIAGYAVSADALFVFIRGEYARQYRILQRALEEARAAGYLGAKLFGTGYSATIRVMRGANAYISGLDTALLESMEGKKAWPRQPPPFPTTAGLLGCPTVVNNVETIAMVPELIRLGAEAFAKLGFEKSGGTCVYSISGHAAEPGIYEFRMGTPLSEILAAAGGAAGGRAIKAVIPGGTSTPMLLPKNFGVRMDFDSLRGAGSFLGAGGIVVLDESADMARALHIIERFLAHESCGQCTPCREGAGWITRILERLNGGEGASGDLENLERVGENITGKVICALGDTVGMVCKATLSQFRPEFEAKLKGGKP